MKERLDALFAHFTSRSPTYLNTLPSLKTRAQLLKFSLLPLHLYLTRYDSSLQSKLFYGFLFLFETRSMRLFLLFYSLFFLSLSWSYIKNTIFSRKIFYFNKIRRGEKVHVSILNIYSTFPSNSTHFVPRSPLLFSIIIPQTIFRNGTAIQIVSRNPTILPRILLKKFSWNFGYFQSERKSQQDSLDAVVVRERLERWRGIKPGNLLIGERLSPR